MNNRKDVYMYKQKLTLDPKLSEVCEATLTVYDPEPLNEEAATEAVNFTVVGSGVISTEEKQRTKRCVQLLLLRLAKRMLPLLR